MNKEKTLRKLEQYLEEIKESFGVEYAEVKIGRWYVLDECSNAGAYCSVCHKKVYKECYGNCKMKSAYCPNCGAKMEKEQG